MLCRDSSRQARGTGKGEEVHLVWCKPSSQASCLPVAHTHAPCTYSPNPLSTPESCKKRWRKRRLRCVRGLPCAPVRAHKDQPQTMTDIRQRQIADNHIPRADRRHRHPPHPPHAANVHTYIQTDRQTAFRAQTRHSLDRVSLSCPAQLSLSCTHALGGQGNGTQGGGREARGGG
jgi:hypothetical protein